MVKKLFPIVLFSFTCTCATKITKDAISTPQSSEIFGAIHAYSVWNSNDAKWNKQAEYGCKAGAAIGTLCMKAALAGSGAGPMGTIVAVTAVGL